MTQRGRDCESKNREEEEGGKVKTKVGTKRLLTFVSNSSIVSDGFISTVSIQCSSSQNWKYFNFEKQFKQFT